MAGTVIADKLEAASTSTLVLKNGVASAPPTIQDSAGTEIGTFCRAWVNFNGTGAVAIRADFNVTDITDNGLGEYTVNITTALPDANYSAVGTCSDGGNGYIVGLRTGTAYSTTAIAIGITNASTGRVDLSYINIAIFR